MNPKMQKFFNDPPEVVIEWQDDQSPARGWAVINSLRGGAAGGGTRIHTGCTKDEVVELAKTMEIKFTVSGPDIGGAKSGIDYDFKDNIDKQAVLSRWFTHVARELKTCYGTGGDQNVDQVQDVIPALERLGIRHPQEGIVRGHFKHLNRDAQDKIINNLRAGVSLPINNDQFLNSLGFTISDASTGYGVASACRAFHHKTGSDCKGLRAIIEGFGNVGGAAAYYLFQSGIKVVGIVDKDWYIFDNTGLDIPKLLKERSYLFNPAQRDLTLVKNYREEIEDYPEADIFIPAATSHTINIQRLRTLAGIGIKKIISGANNPFSDDEAAALADANFSVIPDFIANCGMARVFSYLMQPNCVVREENILKDIDNCVSLATSEALDRVNSLSHLIDVSEQIALEKLNIL